MSFTGLKAFKNARIARGEVLSYQEIRTPTGWFRKAISACVANKTYTFSSAQRFANDTFGVHCFYDSYFQKHLAGPKTLLMRFRTC